MEVWTMKIPSAGQDVAPAELPLLAGVVFTVESAFSAERGPSKKHFPPKHVLKQKRSQTASQEHKPECSGQLSLNGEEQHPELERASMLTSRRTDRLGHPNGERMRMNRLARPARTQPDPQRQMWEHEKQARALVR